MHVNPFKNSILALIKACPGGLTEYELIERLRTYDDAFDFADASPNLALFRRHFVVMNALYQLQTELFDGGLFLSISPLDIRLEWVEQAEATLPAGNDAAPLREYYLNWENFSGTDRTDVESMLKRFKARFLAIEERVEALQTLELSADATWEEVKRNYRRLASQHHPDKGGDPTRFRSVRLAYEMLQRCYTV